VEKELKGVSVVDSYVILVTLFKLLKQIVYDVSVGDTDARETEVPEPGSGSVSTEYLIPWSTESLRSQ
jgi:hypothetical protein